MLLETRVFSVPSFVVLAAVAAGLAPRSSAGIQPAHLVFQNPPGANDHFGAAAAIYGERMIVSAANENESTTEHGRAFAYRLVNGEWDPDIELSTLIPAAHALSPGDGFGFNVALEGDTAVVGARINNNGMGSAVVYVRDGVGMWKKDAKLSATDMLDELCGADVALSGDTILVGCPAS